MLHEDLRAVVLRLGELASRLHDEEWDIVRNARNNLSALADSVEVMENSFPVPLLTDIAPVHGAMREGE